MCGIVGIISNQNFSIRDYLLKSLKKLEYRGYDSVGFGTSDGLISKSTDNIDKFSDSTGNVIASAAISHTRWATHGEVNINNAHPHVSDNFIIVHNGIIENADELKDDLIGKGYKFYSDTDSEIIAKFFEYWYERELSIGESIKDFYNQVQGTFAILLIKKNENKIYGFKLDSPLAITRTNKKIYLASDITAFPEDTTEAILLEDKQYVVADQENFRLYYFDGEPQINRSIRLNLRKLVDNNKKEHAHFMIKEILEQPTAAKRLINSLMSYQREQAAFAAELIRDADKVLFIAAGTSFHASMIGNHLFNQAGIESHCWIASEFDIPKHITKDSVAILVSQSGETMDLIQAVKHLDEVPIISITNAPHSSLSRKSSYNLDLMAGQEIAVAATKSYTNQCITLMHLASLLDGLERNLDNISEKIQLVIDNNKYKAQHLAKSLAFHNDIYILGRGICYSAALEMALKIKEVSYIHAEGLRGGELKHGTLALIEKDTPVISLIPSFSSEMILNTKEVEARGGHAIKVTNSAYGDFHFEASDAVEFSIYASIIGQLLAYYIAKEKGLPIDKPRNLAKSVTVK